MKGRSFPECALMINALNTLKSAEDQCIEYTQKAFNDDGLVGYGKIQHPVTKDSIDMVAAAGNHYASDSRSVSADLASSADSFAPLFDKHESISKWRNLMSASEATAQKSSEDAKRAKANLDKAKRSGNPNTISKAEMALSAAQRRAENDEQSMMESRKIYDENLGPYKCEFWDEFSTAFNSILDKRIDAAKKRDEIIQEFQSAVDSFVDYDDVKLETYRDAIKNYNEILQNEFNV